MRKHTPVMWQELLTILPKQCKLILDWTLWHGGHTALMVEYLDDISARVVWVDRDKDMLDKASRYLEQYWDTIRYHHGSYAQFEAFATNDRLFDFMLLDIGVNMDHFKIANRGFSIKLDGDLDMRFDRSQWISCVQRLRTTHFQELVVLFEAHTDFSKKYRERIARELLTTIKNSWFETTGQVRARAKNLWISDKNLAILFQTFRIHVNKELDQLHTFMQVFYKYLRPGGRCCLITYHSWEDRIVKSHFKELVDRWVWVLYNKKVLKPSWKETQKNRASRSAKIRVFEKT